MWCWCMELCLCHVWRPWKDVNVSLLFNNCIITETFYITEVFKTKDKQLYINSFSKFMKLTRFTRPIPPKISNKIQLRVTLRPVRLYR